MESAISNAGHASVAARVNSEAAATRVWSLPRRKRLLDFVIENRAELERKGCLLVRKEHSSPSSQLVVAAIRDLHEQKTVITCITRGWAQHSPAKFVTLPLFQFAAQADNKKWAAVRVNADGTERSNASVIERMADSVNSSTDDGSLPRFLYASDLTDRDMGCNEEEMIDADGTHPSLLSCSQLPSGRKMNGAKGPSGVFKISGFVNVTPVLFNCHLDNQRLPAAFEHVHGAPKIFFIVPPKRKAEFATYLRNKAGQAARNEPLFDFGSVLFFFPTAGEISAFEIQTVSLSDPRDTLFIASDAYHWGFSTKSCVTIGMNIVYDELQTVRRAVEFMNAISTLVCEIMRDPAATSDFAETLALNSRLVFDVIRATWPATMAGIKYTDKDIKSGVQRGLPDAILDKLETASTATATATNKRKKR